MVLGTMFAFFVVSSVVIGSEAWRQNQSPEKQFATEIWSEVAAPDSKPRIMAHRVWSKLSSRNGASSKKTA
jgi:hypothetical protein